MMAVILQRLLHWDGCKYAFTHKRALSTQIFKNRSHPGVTCLLQGEKGLEGIITTSASAFKIHLPVPSWKETSGWEWKIRHQAGFPVTGRDTNLPSRSGLSFAEPPSTDLQLAHFLLSDTHTALGSHAWSCQFSYICSVGPHQLNYLGEWQNVHHFCPALRTENIPATILGWVHGPWSIQFGAWSLLKKHLTMELPMNSASKDIVSNRLISLNSWLWH